MALGSQDIVNLSSADELALGDLLAVWKANSSDNRKVSMSVLVEFIEASLSLDDKKDSFVTQYIAPNAEAFNIIVTDSSESIWLIATPTANYTDMTITLPSNLNLEDNQEVLINMVLGVTNLTIDKNGAVAVVGAPTTLADAGTFRLKYDKPFNTWYKVG